MSKKPATPNPPTDKPVLVISERELARAVTNDPALSEDQFTLGGRVFTIIDLEYDEYVTFTTMLKPLFEVLFARFTGGVSIPGIDLSTGLSADGVMRFALADLPEMARIVCSKTEPDITIEEVKKLAKQPFKLAEVVVAQILRNNIINDFSTVFTQLRRLIPTTKQ
jgi:hypothetical protein